MMGKRFILAGDIGATNARLALYATSDSEELVLLAQKTYPSRKYDSFAAIIRSFLKEQDSIPEIACFGIPGPVLQGKVKTTNIPWELSEDSLRKEIPCQKVLLINDLAAIACSIPVLKDESLKALSPGINASNNNVYAVIAPGTGLGQAAIKIVHNKLTPLGSEGGHTDFAPRNEKEIELLQFLLKRFTRVSVERIASGTGLRNIFDFLLERGYGNSSSELEEEIKSEDFGAVIGRRAVLGKDPLCIETVEMFVDALGSHAGNMALTYVCTGGIYIAGGIAPKIEKFLTTKRFIKSYQSKGRLSPIVEATPLYLIRDESAGIKGAAELARRVLPA